MKYAYTYDDIALVPLYSEIRSRGSVVLESQLTTKFKVGVPYISAPMDTVTEAEMAIAMMTLGAFGVIHRFNTIEEQTEHVKTVYAYAQATMDVAIHAGANYNFSDDAQLVWKQIAEIPIGAAVGVTGDYLERAIELYGAGANVLLIDVAHGNTVLVSDAIDAIRERLGNNVDIIAGNVCTADGAANLVHFGVNAIRCGIGGGGMCTTRQKSGVGVPQATAVMECVKGVESTGEYVPVIADGGVRMVGDIAKALSLGADTVMMGSLFAGTRESPGTIKRHGGEWPNQLLFKEYRGSASEDAKRRANQDVKNVEGESTLVPYKGKVKRIVQDMNDGVRSAMSYVNALNLTEFQQNADHVLVTQNGVAESAPHAMR